jgi:hypothetical protein
MKILPDYHCPICGALSELIIGPTQAFCTVTTCNILTFNPSLPDGGASNVQVLDFRKFDKPTDKQK